MDIIFKRTLFLILLVLWPILFSKQGWASNVFDTWVDQHYPHCQKKKEVLFYTEQIKNQYKKKLGKNLDQSLGLRYHLDCSKEKKTLYLDTHMVRTLHEVLAISIKENKIEDLKIQSFMEPKEYQPPQKWLDQFSKKDTQKIDSLSGATLSTNAIKRASTKILNIHQILKDERKENI